MNDDGLLALAAACAKCGACRTACTLYPERRAERAVARGKIALVQAAVTGSDGDARAVRDAIADCLLCGRCERACPNGVRFEELAMRARSALAREIGAPAWTGILFGRVMPSRAVLSAARGAAAAAQRALLARVPTGSGLHYRFPEAFGLSGRTLPAIPARGFVESLAAGEGERGGVMLFVGCVFDHILPQVGRAAYETMRAAADDVAVFRGAACCGLPAMAAGDFESARACARENVRRLRAASPARIVFPCGSCLSMFRRNLPILFPEGDPARDDALWVAARCEDYAGFILSSGVAERLAPPPGGAETVGYHDPCHLSGALGLGKGPRELLRAAAGAAFREMPGADLCCGNGGTFNIRDYGTSARIGERKVRIAASNGTRVIATACSGCILQLRDMAARADPALRVVHLAELVRAAAGRR